MNAQDAKRRLLTVMAELEDEGFSFAGHWSGNLLIRRSDSLGKEMMHDEFFAPDVFDEIGCGDGVEDWTARGDLAAMEADSL